MSQENEVQEVQEKAPTIGDVARQAILDGVSNADALEIVLDTFPEAKTTTASIAWYRNDLRKKGHDVPSPKRAKKVKEVQEAEAEVVEADEFE